MTRLSEQLRLQRWAVAGAVALFQEGNTLPFIARHRKEKTGEMDEENLRKLEAGLEAANKLEARRATMISTLEGLGTFEADPALRRQFEDPAATLTASRTSTCPCDRAAARKPATHARGAFSRSQMRCSGGPHRRTIASATAPSPTSPRRLRWRPQRQHRRRTRAEKRGSRKGARAAAAAADIAERGGGVGGCAGYRRGGDHGAGGRGRGGGAT